MPNKQGWTPLHLAAAYNHLPMFQMLVEKGADLYRKNVDGITPLAILGRSSASKDPLRLESWQILMFASVALYWTTYSLLSNDSRTQAILGVFSTASFITECINHIVSPWSVWKDNSLEVISMHLAMINYDLGFFYMPFRALLTCNVAHISFKGISQAWKERAYDPMRAFRNIVVYTANMTHSLYSLRQTFNRVYCAFNQWRDKDECYRLAKDGKEKYKVYLSSKSHLEEVRKNITQWRNVSASDFTICGMENITQQEREIHQKAMETSILSGESLSTIFSQISLKTCLCPKPSTSDLW